MKRRLSIKISMMILGIILCFTLAACGKKSTDETTTEKTTAKETTTEATTVQETTMADSESVTTETISVEGDIQTIPATYHTSNLGYTMLYYSDNMKFTKGTGVDTYNIKNRMTDVIDPNAYVSVELKTNTTIADVINEVVLVNTITEPVEDLNFTINNYPAKHAFLSYTSGTTDFFTDFYAIQDGSNVFLFTEKYYYVEGSGTSALLYYSMNTFTIN